jgi:deoxyribodipyrimidine photo-lyase
MPRLGAVLFTRDLRVHDNAALAAATRECAEVVPLFVLDERLLCASPNRTAFLADSLADLRASLGGALVVRRGDAATEVARFRPDAVYLSEDVSPFAGRRERRLRERFDVHVFRGATIVSPGEVAPAGSDHYRVFTPYWRVWRTIPIAPAVETAGHVRLPGEVDPGPLPRRPAGGVAPALPVGGERPALERLRRFDPLRYDTGRDELAGDGTSRLSPYLHLGCVSPCEVARRAEADGAEELLRQLCWRDFYAQLLAATSRLPYDDLRPARREWLEVPEAVAAWKEGRTGYPLVDAAMRQLLHEGWIHNRARMIAASFLTKQLGVDWRVGAAHFMEHLVDGDLASNTGNWQWVAGTGTDSRPNRFFNPALQGRRHDPQGGYVRRYVPELEPLAAAQIHDPSPADRRALGYPEPIVDHREAVARLRGYRFANR